MPTTPKPAPPPAAPPAKPPASAATELPEGWHFYCTLGIHSDCNEPLQFITGHATRGDGHHLQSGPLLVMAPECDQATFTKALQTLKAVMVEQCKAFQESAPAEAPAHIARPLPLQQTAAPTTPSAPTPAEHPAAANGCAPQDAIDDAIAAVASLTPDWQKYIADAFRIEFNMPASQKVSTAIKTQAHVDFINNMMPNPMPSA